MHNLLNCLGPSGGSWEALVDVWERSWAQPGHLLTRLETSGGSLGDSMDTIWGISGKSWGQSECLRGILRARRGNAREKMMIFNGFIWFSEECSNQGFGV